ncbi:hypothetical protein K1719_042111 [Acacia pycnantha]|nr:hypothetical protein K1719_042111 [Acacia pycnantha]
MYANVCMICYAYGNLLLFHSQLGNHGSNLTEEELETHTISAWKEGKSYLRRQNNGPGTAFSRRFVSAGPYDNLKDVSLKILQNGVSAVPIIHSSSEDAQVSSIPIVDDNDSLMDIYCRSNITALAKDRAYMHINLDGMTVYQASYVVSLSA